MSQHSTAGYWLLLTACCTTALFNSCALAAAAAAAVQERRSLHDPPGTYEGQTALHIAIVNRDVDMVKFLVQVGGCDRLRGEGIGGGVL
jgi:hypothetical protein